MSAPAVLTCMNCGHEAHNGVCSRMRERWRVTDELAMSECGCAQFVPDWEELQELLCGGER